MDCGAFPENALVMRRPRFGWRMMSPFNWHDRIQRFRNAERNAGTLSTGCLPSSADSGQFRHARGT